MDFALVFFVFAHEIRSEIRIALVVFGAFGIFAQEALVRDSTSGAAMLFVELLQVLLKVIVPLFRHVVTRQTTGVLLGLVRTKQTTDGAAKWNETSKPLQRAKGRWQEQGSQDSRGVRNTSKSKTKKEKLL